MSAYRREIWLVVAIVATLAGLARYSWLPNDPQRLLQDASETWAIPVTEVGRWFSAWTLGDGQAYAVIAADPLGVDIGPRLGYPAYRYSRAGFGWLAYAASLGREEWVPYGLAIAGAISLVTLVVVAIQLRPRLGPRAWLLVVNPAVFVAFAGDTAETLGIVFLTLALATSRLWAAAALGITRPSFLLGLFGRWKLFGTGVGAAALLGILWILRFGFFPDQYGDSLYWPLAGYLSHPSVQGLLLLGLAFATLAVGLRKRDWAWVMSSIAMICLSPAVLESGANSWRAGGFLFVLWAFGAGYRADRASPMTAKAIEASG